MEAGVRGSSVGATDAACLFCMGTARADDMAQAEPKLFIITIRLFDPSKDMASWQD